MPLAIPVILGSAGALATAGAGISGVAAALGLSAGALAGIGAGLSIAGTVAGILFAPSPPSLKMEDGSAAIKQAIGPRVWGYGEYKLGGTFGYWNNDDSGNLRMWLIHASHECDAVVEEWLDTERVQFDSSGDIEDDPWNYNDKAYIHRETYLGSPGQIITGIGDEWDANCLGHGLCSTFLRYSDGGTKTHNKIFPTGQPKYNAVLRLAKIYDPRDPTQIIGNESTYTWNDNQAITLLDFLTRAQSSIYGPIPIGFGYDINTEIDIASFAAAADYCDELIALKAGGFEPRYRSWGAFDGSERKSDVLTSMLLNCDGRLIAGPDGKLRLYVGPPDIPNVVTISDADLYSLQLKPGADQLDRANEVKANYISKVLSWGQTECAAHSDIDSITQYGLETSSIKLRWCPSEGQAQRLCRINLKKNNPKFKGTISGNIALLNCWGERWLNLDCQEIPAFSGIYEISRPRLEFTDEAIIVSYDIQSYDDWYSWNAATDELDPPTVPDLDRTPTTVPIPTGVHVNIESRTLSTGNLAAVGVIGWTLPTNPNLAAFIRYREITSGDDGIWQVLNADPGESSVETPPLKDNTNYETQVSFYGPRDSYSEWSASVPFTAIADPVAPALPYNLQASNTAGTVTVSANAPNDWRSYGLRFYRNNSNTPGTAPQIGTTQLSGPNQLVQITDTPGAGDWWYFVTSINYSNVESTKVGGVLAEVAPAAPVITSPTPPGPFQTYVRRPVIQGTGLNGATVTLYANAVSVGTGVVSGGVWSITPTVDLGIGSNSVTATQTVSGNESPASGSLSVQISSGDSDFVTYLNALTVKPNFTRQGLLNTLFSDLKSNGIFAKLDLAFLAGAHDSQAVRPNIKNPSQLMTLTNSPVFTTDRGVKGTGSGNTVGGYIAGPINPATAGGNYTQNSNCLFVYIRTAATTSVSLTMAEAGNTQERIFSKSATANTGHARNNNTTDSAVVWGASTGLFTISRSSSTAYDRYLNNTLIGSISVASTGIASANIDFLRSSSATYSDAEILAGGFGGALTATDVTNLYNILHTYFQAIGAVA